MRIEWRRIPTTIWSEHDPETCKRVYRTLVDYDHELCRRQIKVLELKLSVWKMVAWMAVGVLNALALAHCVLRLVGVAK